MSAEWYLMLAVVLLVSVLVMEVIQKFSDD